LQLPATSILSICFPGWFQLERADSGSPIGALSRGNGYSREVLGTLKLIPRRCRGKGSGGWQIHATRAGWIPLWTRPWKATIRPGGP